MTGVQTCALPILTDKRGPEDVSAAQQQRGEPLTCLGVGVESLDMHDVADPSPDDHHLLAVALADTDDATQAPVSEVCVA